MERFNLTQLKPGETLIVTTESGSTYHLQAETVLEPVGRTGSLFRGLRATRESDHAIVGRSEAIENEPALLFAQSGEPDGVLRTGEAMKIAWDRDHPESKSSWDIQFGPKFHPVATSRIIGIELVPVEE